MSFASILFMLHNFTPLRVVYTLDRGVGGERGDPALVHRGGTPPAENFFIKIGSYGWHCPHSKLNTCRRRFCGRRVSFWRYGVLCDLLRR